MDDIGKAIVMAGQVLLFIFSITVAIILYIQLTNSAEETLKSMNNSNRGDAIVDIGEEDYRREVLGEEVVLAILDLKDKAESGNTNARVIVNGTKFYYEPSSNSIRIEESGSMLDFDFNSANLRNSIIGYVGRVFSLTYGNKDVLIYN